MTFKHYLPAFAILAATGAVVGLITLTQPPDADLLRQAAAAHVKTLEKVTRFEVVGEVVDVLRADGSLSHLAFKKVDGRWIFDRDLGKDFEARMQDPAASREILERLGRRIVQRFNTDLKLGEGLQYGYRLHREPSTSLAAEVVVSFAYPETQGKRPRGRYIETFTWTAGRWESRGVGALFDAAR